MKTNRSNLIGISQGFCPARKNPFATEHLQKIRYQYSEDSLSKLLEQFNSLGRRASIVGPEGHGKTTLQKELAFAVSHNQTHWIKLRQGDRKVPKEILNKIFSRVQKEDLICIDGAEQLSWWNWKSLLRQLGKKQSCLITSHRQGLLPTLVQCKTSVSLLSDLVTDLTTPLNSPQKKELESLHNKHQGDLRQCLRELYDKCSQGAWTVINEETIGLEICPVGRTIACI